MLRKKLLCGTAAIAINAAIGSAAIAADVPAKPVKAPVAAVAPLPNWSGFYIGGHLGYGEARIAGDWRGDVDQDLTKNLSGIVGGMHAGQNWQKNTFVYGWEADLSAVGLSKSVVKGDATGDLDSIAGLHTKVTALASFRGKLGILFNPNLHGYVTGGLAYGHGKAKAHVATTTLCGSADCLHFQQQHKKFHSLGGVLGLGAEWKQTQNLSWRVEGLYYIFDDSKKFTIGETGKVKLDNVWVVRVGATHHFGADGPAVPVGLPVKALAPATLPIRGWSGFYIGGHLGYGEARIAGNWEGGVDQDLTKNLSGIVGGMHVGQNWQKNTFVYGWEADLSATGWSKSVVKLEPGDEDSIGGLHTKVAALATLRGRLGILFNPNLHGYVTGGLAYAHGKAKAHVASTTEGCCIDLNQQQKKFHSLGGVLGLGAEWKQTQNFSWRLEGLYYIFDDSKKFDIGGETGKVKLDDVWVVRVGATHHFATSDIRLKRDITLLSRLENGLGLYRYRYLWNDQVYVGVMAQEVAKVVPDAVVCGADGYLRVDYARLGLRLMTWDEWTECSRAGLAMAA